MKTITLEQMEKLNATLKKNGRLLEAAPDLLEALKEMDAYIQKACATSFEADLLHVKAYEAIQKAEGK